MREIMMWEALNEALREEMKRDAKVFCLGEDIGLAYVWSVTRGLMDEFGADRVRDTPISESAIMGASVGAALMGMRPVPELQFSDFMFVAMDQIFNQASKTRYMFGGQLSVPLVLRLPSGGYFNFGATHSQSLEALLIHSPGLKVVMPSDPRDGKGLLKSAIRDPNPVAFFEHKALYKISGPVPEEEYTIPLGKADIKRDGTDVCVIALSFMVTKALAAAETLEKEGISAMVLDPRTLVPLDKAGIVEAVRKTNRVVIVEEGCKTGGVGAEISAVINEEAFDYLDAPIARVAAHDAPIPFSKPLEDYILPNEEKIVDAVRKVMEGVSV
ncbi:MAG: alpha-ketoacid dehydrogenase subunit beta [Nitrospinota bacterium]|jgi:pyruvate dehydrogenase E1 component beta subunit|nr:alpha-ketoacid dehydrogenase subunit beta [Nitrospinota bacterium]